MLISIIIPTLNEEASLAATLRPLAECSDVELIVVDGGSSDHTVEVAQVFTPYVFVSPRGRARQMNLGARHATGDILLFLHADTILQPGALDEVQRRIIGDGAVGGAFDLRIDSPKRLCRLIAKISSYWARLLRMAHGDQGVFVWRQVFEALECFPELPIMEDLAFGRQLRRAGRLSFISDGLVTSGRRWDANGAVKTTLVNWWVTLLFLLRVPPWTLRRAYDRWLVSGHARPGKAKLVPPSERKLQEQP
jgi:rSAM/selenodomain-associated transferase 2